MSSLLAGPKQLRQNGGYYINVASCMPNKVYQNVGTDAAPLMSASQMCANGPASTFLATAGSAVFRDHGKTIVSSARVFRKVQLLVSTNSVLNNGTDGVGGVDTAPFNYLTGYVELPGTGNLNSGVLGSSLTPVARLG